MRVTVNFSLKRSKSRSDGKCPVYVRCTMNNQRFELSTGIFVVPDNWDDERQRNAGRTEKSKILNNRLDKIRIRVQDVYNQLESKGEPFSILQVKSKLLGVSNEKGVLEILDRIIKGIASRVGNDYSEGTLKHYKIRPVLENRTQVKAKYGPHLPQASKKGFKCSHRHESAFP